MQDSAGKGFKTQEQKEGGGGGGSSEERRGLKTGHS